jgi:hypothetical protein
MNSSHPFTFRLGMICLGLLLLGIFIWSCWAWLQSPELIHLVSALFCAH